MKGIIRTRYGGPDVLEVANLELPTPSDGEVRIQVHAAGLDRGVWHVMTGLPYMIRAVVPVLGLRAPKEPVLGMDLAGRVDAVGEGVTRFAPTDEVFGWCDGSYAEYVCVPPDQLVAKPSNLTFEQAAAVPISGVAALQAVRNEGKLRAGERVLVLGAAGGVGTFVVQLAKIYGAEVTAVCAGTHADLVRSLGADDVIDYTRHEITDDARRWDLVVDTAGHRRLSALRHVLTSNGTLVIVGSEVGGRWLGGFDRQLRGLAWSRLVGQRLRMLSSKLNQQDLEILGELAAAGQLAPVVDRTYPLVDVPAAIDYLVNGRRHGGKIVITV